MKLLSNSNPISEMLLLGSTKGTHGPLRRFEYDRVVWQLLKPKGKLLGLFLPLDKDIDEGGPPWGVSIRELHDLFSLHWTLESEEMPRESIDRRADRETLMIWSKN